ncbi:MAG: hypothetical protein ACYCWA_10305 [Thiobacillus sp.]
MSPNSIRGRASFSFKGEVYEPEAVIDLDACLGEQDAAPDFHRLLGRAAGIDPDSYLYEVFESHPITFSDAAGAAAPHCVDGGFDWKHFEQDRATSGTGRSRAVSPGRSSARVTGRRTRC